MTGTTMDYVGNVVIFFEFYGFFTATLRNRNPILNGVLGTAVIGLGIPSVYGILPQKFLFFVTLGAFILLLALGFDGKIREKVTSFCIAYLCINLSQILSMSIMGTFGRSAEVHVAEHMIMSSLLIVASMFFAYHTWSSMALLLSSPKFMSFFLLPISQFAMIILMVFFVARISETNYFYSIADQKWLSLAFCLVCVLSLVADSLFLSGVVGMAKSIRERERLQALEAESELTYEYIKNMESDIDEMRKYRHDFLNMLTSVQLAVEGHEGGQNGDATRLISQMTDELHSMTGKRYCGCNLVNCLLAHEEKKLSENGITCDFRAEVPESLGVNELDLCRLLTNLFDNAGSSCMQVEESARRIEANMRVCEGYLYISIRNSRPGGELSMNTAKDDKKLHGLGLKIVREIIGRNDGEFILAEEPEALTVTATLRWQE